MSKMSRRKQSKPQHVSNDSDVEEKKLEIDLQPGPSQEALEEDDPALSLAAEQESADVLTPLAPEEPGLALSSELIASQTLRRTNRRRSATQRSLESTGLGTSESETEESDGEEGGPSPAKKPADSSPGPRPMPGRPMTSGQPHRLIRRTCQYCGEVKPTPAALQRHLRKHTGERPFVCTGCHKAYKAKRSLQLHQLTYHPELIDNKKGGLGSRGAPNMIRSAIARRLERQQLSRHRPEPGEVLPPTSSPFSSPSLASPPLVSPPTFAMAPPPPLNSATAHGDRFGGMSPIENYYASQVMRHMPDFRSPGGSGQGTPTPTTSFEQTSPSPSPVRSTMENPRAVLPGAGMGHGLLGPGFLYNGVGGEGGDEMIDGESTLDSRTCKVCQKVCAKPSDVKRHMLVHSGLKPFPCVRCGKGFKAKGSMLYHMKAAHNIDVELSQGLEKRYMEQKNRAFRRSLYAKEATPTKSPDESMLEPDAMSDDASLHYSEEKPASMLDRGMVGGSIGRVITEEGPFKQNSINVRNETVLVTRLDGIRVDSEEEVTLYKCYICGCLFNKLSRVQCHLSVHFQLEMATFQCSVCEETFSQQEDMLCHLEQQHGISRDSAMNGEEGLTSAAGIKDTNQDSMEQESQRLGGHGHGMVVGPDGNNSSIYTGRIRPYWRRHGGRYSCKICHKTFINQSILSRHELAHKGQLPLNHLRQRMRPSLDMMSRYRDRRGGLRSRYRSLPRIPLQDQGKPQASNMPFCGERGQLSLKEGLKREEAPLPSTSQDADNSVDVMEKQQVLEEAKEILEKEGIEEDITVVVPSDPPSENQDPLSDTPKSPGSEMASDSQDTEDLSKSDTLKPPSKSLLSSFRRESKSRRKSSQPVKLGSKPEDTPKSSPSYPVANSENSSSYHSTPPEKNSPTESENAPPPRSRADASLDHISSLMGAYSHAAAMQGLHPYFLAAAASQAVAASQAGTSGQAASTQGLLHANGLMPGLPPTSLALSPLLHPSLSVQVPGDGRTLKSPSPSLSPSSQTSPSDPDSLVGYPRVQWGQVPGAEPLAMTSKDVPSWHPMASMSEAMRVSVDGRKVTSLSRTHSRLHVVKQPVDREMACKPTTLPDGRTVYRCNVCNKEFLSYSDINRHMDFHEDIRPYKCKFCEYYARTNSQLKVHMMRHQGIREYCCRLCNYKGVTQSDLNRHMKSQIHMLKSSHQCPDCGEGFVSMTSLESHKCKIRNMNWFKTEAAPTS